MIKLKATIVVEYDADPKRYGTDDPHMMAQIDMDNCAEDIIGFGELVITIEPGFGELVITIEPIPE